MVGPPQAWRGQVVADEQVELVGHLAVVDRLRLEGHRVLDPAESLECELSSPFGNHLVQVSAWDECVDEVAFERVSGALERVELYASGPLGLFKACDGGLCKSHPVREVFGGHAESVADGSDPAAVRAGALRRDLSPTREALVEGSTSPRAHLRTCSHGLSPHALHFMKFDTLMS
jgi:hypothetical protein